MIALLRLGRREAWRHKLRSTLVLVLILLPVGLSSAALVLLPLIEVDPDVQATMTLGDADAWIMGSSSPDLEWLDSAPWNDGSAPAGARALQGATFTAWVPAAANDDLVAGVDVEQVAVADPMIVTRHPVEDGRLPERPGEVALDAHSMERFGVGIGDTLRVAVPEGEWKVVGESATVECSECSRVLLAADTVERPTPPSDSDPFPPVWTSVNWIDEWFVGGMPDASMSSLTNSSGGAGRNVVLARSSFESEGADRPSLARAGVVAAGAFALLWTGLVAASGLAVGARRRKRELGLLAANGADPMALRLAVISEGLVLGAVGAATGVAVGVVAARFVAPLLADSPFDRVPPSIPFGWLSAVWLVGTAAAVVAAWSAAVGIASLTPAQLLRGHRPTPRPAPAWFAAGLGALVAGLALLTWGRWWTDQMQDSMVGPGIVIALGVLGVSVGVIASVVGATRIAGRLTASAPTSVRLAGRDISRQGIRIAAAAAAVAVTLTGVATAVSLDAADLSQLDESRSDPSAGMPVADLDGATERVGMLSTSLSRVVDGRVLPLVVEPTTAEALRSTDRPVAVVRDFAGAQLRSCFGSATATAPEHCEPAPFAVLDEAALGMLPDVQADQLRSGSVLSFWEDLVDGTGAPVVSVSPGLNDWSGGLGPLSSSSAVWMTAPTAQRLGLDTQQPASTDVYVDLDGVDAEELAQLRRDARGMGFEIGVVTWGGPTGSGLSTAAVYAIGFGVLSAVTLLIVMIALALVRVESRSDDDVLLIAGAAPGLSRRISAARGGLMVLGAALPSMVAGWCVARALTSVGPVPVPWVVFGVGVVALTLLTALVAGVFHRPSRRLSLQ